MLLRRHVRHCESWTLDTVLYKHAHHNGLLYTDHLLLLQCGHGWPRTFNTFHNTAEARILLLANANRDISRVVYVVHRPTNPFRSSNTFDPHKSCNDLGIQVSWILLVVGGRLTAVRYDSATIRALAFRLSFMSLISLSTSFMNLRCC